MSLLPTGLPWVISPVVLLLCTPTAAFVDAPACCHSRLKGEKEKARHSRLTLPLERDGDWDGVRLSVGDGLARACCRPVLCPTQLGVRASFVADTVALLPLLRLLLVLGAFGCWRQGSNGGGVRDERRLLQNFGEPDGRLQLAGRGPGMTSPMPWKGLSRKLDQGTAWRWQMTAAWSAGCDVYVTPRINK